LKKPPRFEGKLTAETIDMLEGHAMTTRYYLELSFIVSNHGTSEDLEAHLDCVADFLADLDGVVDPDIGANLSAGTVTFTMSVDAEAQPQALMVAQVGLRTAMHAAKGCTAGWEDLFQDGRQVVTPSELSPA
jgi:hypothetical protein